MSALRPAFFIQYLESCISRLNVIPCHDLTLSVGEPDNAAAKLRSEQTVTPLHEQSPATYFLRLNNLETFVELVGARPLHLLSQTVLPLKSPTGAFIAALCKRGLCVLSAAVEGKNRPVATNFQFLKMFCPSGTSLLQCVCISEVILLGRACPKPCSSFVPSGTNGTACRALHNFTEELSNRQEVQ